jgi:hypothetical protein
VAPDSSAKNDFRMLFIIPPGGLFCTYETTGS